MKRICKDHIIRHVFEKDEEPLFGGAHIRELRVEYSCGPTMDYILVRTSFSERDVDDHAFMIHGDSKYDVYDMPTWMVMHVVRNAPVWFLKETE